MRIPFVKMHGIGNDYIYIDCMREDPAFDPAPLSRAMSPRHFSVGADGVVLICRSERADARMRMFNLDGSEGRMCGNAIRCVGKFLYDNGYCRKTELTVDTLSGIKRLRLQVQDGAVSAVAVDMGFASFDPAVIPLAQSKELIAAPVVADGREWALTAVSMGNPHAVCFTEGIDSLDLAAIGPGLEFHPLFPERVNTEFVEVIDRTHLRMRVWERGSGETWACGTGACAVVAAAVRNGIVPAGEEITVSLRGGELRITCGADWHIDMTGPAAKVYEGVYEYVEAE